MLILSPVTLLNCSYENILCRYTYVARRYSLPWSRSLSAFSQSVPQPLCQIYVWSMYAQWACMQRTVCINKIIYTLLISVREILLLIARLSLAGQSSGSATERQPLSFSRKLQHSRHLNPRPLNSGNSPTHYATLLSCVQVCDFAPSSIGSRGMIQVFTGQSQSTSQLEQTKVILDFWIEKYLSKTEQYQVFEQYQASKMIINSWVLSNNIVKPLQMSSGR